MRRPAPYPVLAAAAALAAVVVVSVLALFSIQLWRAEGERIEAARQEALSRETDLALWAIEGRAAAIAAAPPSGPSINPPPTPKAHSGSPTPACCRPATKPPPGPTPGFSAASRPP